MVDDLPDVLLIISTSASIGCSHSLLNPILDSKPPFRRSGDGELREQKKKKMPRKLKLALINPE